VQTQTATPAQLQPRNSLLVIGDFCVDLILTGDVRPRFGQVEQVIDDASLEMGGSAAIFASQSAKLGAQVKVVGSVGGDPFGQLITAELSRSGADVSRLRPHPVLKTGIGVALSMPSDRAILTYLGTMDALRPEDLDEALFASCRHVHMASYFLLDAMRAEWPGWFAFCRERGITISMDTNWDPKESWQGLDELLPYVDVFLPNEAEALAISRASDVEAAGRNLASLGPLVVIKRGPEGATAFGKQQQWSLVPGRDTGLPARVVDTTGAGDNFDAGFMQAWLNGAGVPACLALGHRCAISSLEERGGTRGQLMESSILAGTGSRAG
jgi:sugar/nucleoside kinase (ribokinase family)